MKHAWVRTLRVEIDETHEYPRLRLLGEGDADGARNLARAIRELIDDGQTRLILDTRDLRFLDPECCRILEAGIAELDEEGGQVVVVDASLPVERSLKLLDLERLVRVVPSASQAAAYLDWHA